MQISQGRSAAGIRAMKPEMRSLGLRAGFITQEQVDNGISLQSAFEIQMDYFEKQRQGSERARKGLDRSSQS